MTLSPQPRNRRSAYKVGSPGFTLVEMMLAVFLIGITATLVVINVDSNQDDIARLEAERFAALVGHMRDESVIVGYPIAVQQDLVDNQYRFYELRDSWKLVDRDDVLRPRLIPQGVQFSIQLIGAKSKESEQDQDEDQDEDEDEIQNSAPKDLIVAEPGGLITQFIALFSGESDVFSVTLDNRQELIVAAEDSG